MLFRVYMEQKTAVLWWSSKGGEAQVIVVCQSTTNGVTLWRMLCRPNRYKALELEIYTVPSFGEALCSRSVTFNPSIHPVKSYVCKGTVSKGHGKSVQNLIWKDWFNDIYEVIEPTCVYDDHIHAHKIHNLKQLLLTKVLGDHPKIMFYIHPFC